MVSWQYKVEVNRLLNSEFLGGGGVRIEEWEWD